jgi:hypothetical protein
MRHTHVFSSNLKVQMNNVTIGILLSLSALILLYKNQWALGLAAFVIGILVMNKKNRRK